MSIYKNAISKADEVRYQLGLNIFEPINVIDSCAKLGVTVRFVDINMEGLYVSQKNGLNPTILISNQRPFPRRNFTCGHELGHHFYNHGLMIDTIHEEQVAYSLRGSDEQLVDAFAGALLMPLAGVQAEFNKRNWIINKANAVEFYTIASTFNVGYQTLITHCKVNNLINESKFISLLKYKPYAILKSKLNFTLEEKSYFKIIDYQSKISTIDLEVTNYVILPSDIQVEGDVLKKCGSINSNENVYKAIRPGITRAYSEEREASYFVRIQNLGYIGLAEYRHLEN